jgi:transcriptional regulator with XRE-family HTH domain
MKVLTKRRVESEPVMVRVLGRGLGSRRGVHLTLRSLRDAAGKTQGEVSAASGIDQGDISRLEGRELLDDALVSTVRRYLAALGAELELTAVFGDKRIVVVGSSLPPTAVRPANKPLQRAGRKAARR